MMTIYFFQKSIPATLTPLFPTEENEKGWQSVHLDPNDLNLLNYASKMENFALEHMSTVNTSYDEDYKPNFSFERREYQTHVEADNISISISKHHPKDFQKYGKEIDLKTHYKNHAVFQSTNLEQFKEEIQIPTTIHFTNNSECQDKPFSLLTAVYRSFGPNAPLLRNPKYIIPFMTPCVV